MIHDSRLDCMVVMTSSCVYIIFVHLICMCVHLAFAG